MLSALPRPTKRVQKGGSSSKSSFVSRPVSLTKMLKSRSQCARVGTAVVGSTATDKMSSPIRALRKVVFPALNFPETAMRIGAFLKEMTSSVCIVSIGVGSGRPSSNRNQRRMRYGPSTAGATKK
jgi:hypothetical protein